MQRAEAEELGKRLVRVLETKDMTGLLALLSDDFVLWHNVTGRRLENGAGQAFLVSYFPTMKYLKYRDIRILPTEDGWVQQHRLDSETADGAVIRDLDAILVIRGENGKIHGIEEYFDGARVQPPAELLTA
jgi:ketosteroid isomerase-like protein